MASSRVRRGLSKITVEPVLFLHFIGENIEQLATTSLISKKVCSIHFNFTQEICNNISNLPNVDKVQEYTTTFKLYLALIRYLPVVLVAIFLGSWSDQYGRKTLLILSVCGTALQSLGLLLNSFFEDAPLKYILVATIPEGIGGGSTMLTLAGFSYVSDISTPSHTRTLRMSLLHSMMFVGPPIGTFAGAAMVKNWALYPPFAINLSFHVICLIYIVYKITESRDKVDGKRRSRVSKVLQVLHIDRVIESFKTLLKDRERQKRRIIYMLLVGYSARSIAVNGQNIIFSLYTKRQFAWNVQQVGLFVSLNAISNLLGASIILPLLLHHKQLSDAKSGAAGVISATAAALAFSLSFTNQWIMYFGVCLAVMGGTIPSVIRSALSKYVDPKESGRIFSMIAIIDAMVPLIGTVLFSQVYKLTLLSYPGTVFIIATVFSILPAAVFLWMYIIDKTAIDYNIQE